MATISKYQDTKGKTSYRVRVRLKGHPVQSATFDRLTDAKEWAKKTEVDIKEGRHFPKRDAQKYTVADLIERYKLRVMPEKKPSTQASQKNQLQWWKDELGALSLAAITPTHIADCRDKLLDGGRSPATVNRYLAVISHAFTYAVKELRWLEDNPCQKVTNPKEPKGRTRFLSDDERKRLLDACKESSSKQLYPAVLLAMSTGMRRGEQFGLRWQDVDLQTGRIILTDTKNGETRVAIATGPALDELRKLAKVRRIDCDLVFPGRLKKCQPVVLERPFREALEAAEIEDFRWHDLRHCFASELAMSGATLAELAEAMGHKTLDMVKRYAHLTEGHISSVVERMTARVFGGDV
ncbi:MAG: tyrosine-type recombinase/integrase [Mariprofundus sp.]